MQGMVVGQIAEEIEGENGVRPFGVRASLSHARSCHMREPHPAHFDHVW